MLRKIVIYICHVFILFGFLFEIPIVGPITTRRLSLIVAIVTLIFYKSECKEVVSLISKKKIKQCLVFFGICFLIAVFNSMGVLEAPYTDYFEPWYIINIFLYVIVFSFYTVAIFKDSKAFAATYLSCFAIQTVAVYAAVMSTPVRLFLYEVFYSGDDRFERTIENGTRIMGIALSESAGSIVCSTGVILLTFLAMRKHIGDILYFIIVAFLLSMTTFIGRTGILVELAILAFYVVYIQRQKAFKILPLAILAAFFIVYAFGTLMENSDTAMFDYLVEWMTSSFTKEGRLSTLEGINQELPSFSFQFILGTGVMRGKLPNGETIASDSGYIMLCSAIGIIGGFLFYLAHWNLYRSVNFNITEKQVKMFLYLCMLLSFIIECKEPFMQKYIFSYILITVSLFYQKETKLIKLV